jgi:membrane protease YdiL (CAAX protease family)
MTSHSYDYFKESWNGESRWWSWVMVAWFTILGWLFVQFPITGPIPDVARAADPELGAQIDQAMADMTANMNLSAVGLFTLVFLGGTLAGVLFWILNRNAKGNTQTIFGILTGLGVATSMFGLIKLFPMISDPEANNTMMQAMGVSPLAYMLFLLVFPFSLIALYLGQKFLHKRTILSLHTAAEKIRWSRGLQAFLLTWGVLGSFTLIGHVSSLSPINTNFDAGRFAIYALVSILFLPLQSGTEEIVFRGYLNQGFSHILKNKWVAFVITSILFSCLHLSNPEALKGAEDGILILTMSSYFFFGFIACLMVWMDDGLESAIGFHTGNNTFAAIFVNYEGSVLPTPSLFMASPNTAIDVPISLAAMSLIALILYKTRNPLDMTA